MKTKTKKLAFFSELYAYEVEINISTDIKRERNTPRNVKRLGMEYSGINPWGMFSYNNEDRMSTIFIDNRASLGTISHECWHCIYRIFEECGAGFDNEVVAYTLSYLVDEVYKLKKQK